MLKRWSEAERRELLGLQAKSGLSAAAFCREHGIEVNTFYHWRNQARPKADFVEVPRTPGFELEFDLGDGRVLRYRAD